MRIDFECSGGYANVRLAYHGNTDELPQEVAKEALRLVESSRVFDIEQSEVAPTSAGPPDVFFYRLSLQEGNRRKTLSFNDVTAPEALHPLLALLRKLAWEQVVKKNIIASGDFKKRKPRFEKAEMHGVLPNCGTVVSASKCRGGALYKYPNK
jgi:hypothetical protein